MWKVAGLARHAQASAQEETTPAAAARIDATVLQGALADAVACVVAAPTVDADAA